MRLDLATHRNAADLGFAMRPDAVPAILAADSHRALAAGSDERDARNLAGAETVLVVLDALHRLEALFFLVRGELAVLAVHAAVLVLGEDGDLALRIPPRHALEVDEAR